MKTDGKCLPIMRRSFLRGKNKPCQSGGRSWAHGGNGHYCKMLETLAAKNGQLRQCVLEILTTADSFGQKRSGNSTLRVSLTQGTGCFQLLQCATQWSLTSHCRSREWQNRWRWAVESQCICECSRAKGSKPSGNGVVLRSLFSWKKQGGSANRQTMIWIHRPDGPSVGRCLRRSLCFRPRAPVLESAPAGLPVLGIHQDWSPYLYLNKIWKKKYVCFHPFGQMGSDFNSLGYVMMRVPLILAGEMNLLPKPFKKFSHKPPYKISWQDLLKESLYKNSLEELYQILVRKYPPKIELEDVKTEFTYATSTPFGNSCLSLMSRLQWDLRFCNVFFTSIVLARKTTPESSQVLRLPRKWHQGSLNQNAGGVCANPRPRTRAFSPTIRTPQGVHTVWGT